MILLTFALAACGHANKGESTAADNRTLYERLGGKPAIAKVVDDFVVNVAADSRINLFFQNTDIPAFKAKLVDQICDAASSGKECQYKGKSMKDAHATMGVKSADFDALVEDLKKSLDSNHVGAREQNELLGVLAPMKKDIVTK